MRRNCFYFIAGLTIVMCQQINAGNPDRQGEAGAYELTINPWARAAGLHGLTTSMVWGVESLWLNPAGLARINKTELLMGHTQYLRGSGISINALGFAQKMGTSGAFGFTLVAMDLGDINVTTTQLPEGTGATYSPTFLNLGLSYAYTFENKVSVGILVRGISESTSDLSAFGFAFDAGVQYVNAPEDNFKFGISLRNVGSPMRFNGEGLSFQGNSPEGDVPYNLTFDQRSAGFELPSLLNIGTSYDLNFDKRNRLSIVANFTANSFSSDEIGGGLEYGFNKVFYLRGGYKHQLSQGGADEKNVYTGLSAGFGIEAPFKKDSKQRLGIDYGYRASNPWSGSHSLSLKLAL
ncbi:MAG: PorV/PorQ family protein [Saprospiraceae bacterium]|nr:PorV/PorQ family protein [Saprospiraceae bacterium]